MPACLTRYASTMSALLTSARTDSLRTVKDANANPDVSRSGSREGR
jgi:hypothetical protein